MADSERGERTEEATQQRREDFRRRGQVAQTRELSSAIFIFGALLCIWMAGSFMFNQIAILFHGTMGDKLVQSIRLGNYNPILQFSFVQLLILAGPILIFFWILTIVSSVIQTGFLYNEEALQFKPERLDPVAGLQKIFSKRSLAEGVKSVLKLILIGVVTYFVIRSELKQLPQMAEWQISQILFYIGNLVVKLLSNLCVVLFGLALADYLYQRWELEKEMMMTKQEIKEEIKSREGDPLIKARIKRIQRDIATKRMMDDVKKADVIVTNPTHIAVALKYDDTMIAPKVIAKGADHVAERIRNIARELNIPIVENKPLARTMFKTLKIGQMIPRELYTAVAEVLSYIYRLKRRMI